MVVGLSSGLVHNRNTFCCEFCPKVVGTDKMTFNLILVCYDMAFGGKQRLKLMIQHSVNAMNDIYLAFILMHQ